MPFTKTVEPGNKLPPVEASYHLILLPVALRLETVAPEQKLCGLLPVGAAGGLQVVLVEPFKVILPTLNVPPILVAEYEISLKVTVCVVEKSVKSQLYPLPAELQLPLPEVPVPES